MSVEWGTMKQYTHEQMVDGLRKVAEEKTQKYAAIDLGISPQYFNDLLHGKREITERVAKELGFRRRIVFERIAK